MIPVLLSAEAKALDAAADGPTSVLVHRAGLAVTRVALRILGGGYGRRVVVVVGKGNNGADGRDAAIRLRRRGARVQVIEAADAPDRLPPADLVIDAIHGTGFRLDAGRPFRAPMARSRVLSVDLPSGVDSDTGDADDGAFAASDTIALAGLKPGLLFGRGAELAGEIHLADIGLDGWSVATVAEVGDDDVRRWLPTQGRDAHKWKTAVKVIAGSPGMMGSATLVARAAQRSGAGMVRLAMPGVELGALPVGEAVATALPSSVWAAAALEDIDRYKAAVIGPGLGLHSATVSAVRRFVADCPIPLLIDGDAITALGEKAGALLAARVAPTVVTPHDAEFARLGGDAGAPDRITEARRLSQELGAVVLWKGATTVVAGRGELTLLTSEGPDARLATAGTGDVLSGIISAYLARGLTPSHAAAAGSRTLTGSAQCQHGAGLVAGDVVQGLRPYFASIGAPV